MTDIEFLQELAEISAMRGEPFFLTAAKQGDGKLYFELNGLGTSANSCHSISNCLDIHKGILMQHGLHMARTDAEKVKLPNEISRH